MYPLTSSGCFFRSSSLASSISAGANWASRRFISTVRSPGTPTTTSSRHGSSWSSSCGCMTAMTTFFRMSEACQSRPSERGWLALANSTILLMVAASGVGRFSAAGVLEKSTGSGSGVCKASTFQALPDGDWAKVSSPIGIGARNSSDSKPPIGPAMACTGTYLMSRRLKMRS